MIQSDALTRRASEVYSNTQIFVVITFIGNLACIYTLMASHDGRISDGGLNSHLSRVVIITKDHIKGIALNGG